MKFNVDSFGIFNDVWALLTAGDKDGYNSMTISWGGLGTLWSKPVATVYVKPVRYTHQFMEKSDYFTVSFFSEEYRNALMLMGMKSGRNADKVKEAGLTADFLENSVMFKEAKTTLLCKKIYKQDLDVGNIPEDVVKAFYTDEAAHTMYIGEVVDIIEG
ncbi:MAG: flavin reductase [Oscillospiraceae bacterium]|nr:flavin reductase [Oscillospiraceae bacterium]